MVAATFTIGTHNLADESGLPTAFADVIGYTEAAVLGLLARYAEWTEKRQLIVCQAQRSLALSLKKDLFRITERMYFRAHEGEARVTPARGTFIVKTIHRPTGRKVAFVLEHRINAAFPPFVRGEDKLRETNWRKHQKLTLHTIRVLKQENYTVFALGDLNTPSDVEGYAGHLTELGHGYDRIACSRDAGLADFQRLSRVGSDHHRIKATAEL